MINLEDIRREKDRYLDQVPTENDRAKQINIQPWVLIFTGQLVSNISNHSSMIELNFKVFYAILRISKIFEGTVVYESKTVIFQTET